MKTPKITLTPLTRDDREQFILDNQYAFKFGAVEEFGLRDNHFEDDGEIISRETIERSINHGVAYRIRLDGKIVGGLVLKIDEKTQHNELELLFVSPDVHSKGVGAAASDSKLLDGAIADLRAITGQQPMVCRAKKSIAGFHIREGMAIGAKVTLRGDRMWEFLDRLLAVALPRVRDFRGINPDSFDGRGNYSLGITEQLIFPEIDYDKIDRTRGMDITVVTSAETDEQGYALLKALGFPFKERK